MHGSKDQLVPTQQSIQFAEKLEKVLGKDKVNLVLLPGVHHGGLEFESEKNIDIVFSFLDNILK
jgi:dipeptidyl aminopeptidase/acylaminoacyl peptidase